MLLSKECRQTTVFSQNSNKISGKGVFDGSVKALLDLNQLGYGTKARSDLELVLVFNPGGPSLPSPQSKLEGQYREELRKNFGIEFTKLATITNMPIKRYFFAMY